MGPYGRIAGVIAKYSLCVGLFAALGPVAAPIDIEGLKLEADPDDEERVLVYLDAVIQDVPQQVDRQMGGRLGVSCSRNIHWDGGTVVREGGSSLTLRSNVRYEQWLCAILKTRLFRKTFVVDWTVRVNEGGRIDALVLTAQLANIRDIPGELEQWFNLHERMKRDIKIQIPSDCGKCDCATLAEGLNPVADRFRFEVQEGDVLVKAVFSVAKDLGPLARCI